MTDREQLIELLEKYKTYDSAITKVVQRPMVENLADYLLANGVILPPCKVGDKVWFVCFGKIYPHKIKSIEVSEFGMYANSSSLNFNFEHFGKTVFLTKEEAEAKLKELKE